MKSEAGLTTFTYVNYMGSIPVDTESSQTTSHDKKRKGGKNHIYLSPCITLNFSTFKTLFDFCLNDW